MAPSSKFSMHMCLEYLNSGNTREQSGPHDRSQYTVHRTRSFTLYGLHVCTASTNI